MQKQLTLGEKTIQYIFKKSRRAKRLRLAVHADGMVIVTAPILIGESFVEQFLVDKGDWILSKLAYFKKFVGVHWMRSSKREYLAFREVARTHVLERLRYFNRFYHFTYNRVSIRNQKTRWGSCSRQGNLSFNYKIALLPVHLADYIIVHELCHLREFNHSPRFWKLIEETIPNYRECRQEIHAIGFSHGGYKS